MTFGNLEGTVWRLILLLLLLGSSADICGVLVHCLKYLRYSIDVVSCMRVALISCADWPVDNHDDADSKAT